eukprot:TRINITY_DN20664_c0_g1_i1.p1 TRINITY_DN20664_c0_g1~~TRINITY_DN20664_c0_g1_i1.p1  ORF type:complete len:841 (+),score=43.40 TRINITY_DN20664_c0_g1_i1:111-2525(+)
MTEQIQVQTTILFKVVVVGGGNAAHAALAVLGSQPNVELSILANYADDAERINKGLESNGGAMTGKDILGARELKGRARLVTNKAADVIPEADLIFLAVPAFGHRACLVSIAGLLKKGAIVVAMPAQSGFNWEAISSLGPAANNVIIAGLTTLPWACRILNYGVSVEIRGWKQRVGCAVHPARDTERVAERLSSLLSPVLVEPIPSFLAITMTPLNQVVHPAIMYGSFNNWDGSPYKTAPLCYEGMSDVTAKCISDLTYDVLEIKAALQKEYPTLDLSMIVDLKTTLLATYTPEIVDKSTLQSCFSTNKAYTGLTVPMAVFGGGTPHEGGLQPDFQCRFLSEDIPYGLAVMKGVGELLDVKTPAMDKILLWGQKKLNKEYIAEDGSFTGKDLRETRAPQAFGIHTKRALVQSAKPESLPKFNPHQKTKFLVVGAGNLGPATAGYLALHGYDVNFGNRTVSKLQPVIDNGNCIEIRGVVNGVGRLNKVSGNWEELMQDRDVIMLCLPANGHVPMLKQILPYLKSTHHVILHVSQVFGSIQCHQFLMKERPELRGILITEAECSMFTCRATDSSDTEIFAIKQDLGVATLPSDRNAEAFDQLKPVFPFLAQRKNVLHTALCDYQFMVHPVVVMFNAGPIERGQAFLFYIDGVTQHVASVLAKVDAERCMISNYLDIKPMTLLEYIVGVYSDVGCKGDNLYDAFHSNPAYKTLYQPKELYSRYIWEDLPNGLLPVIEMAHQLGLKTPVLDCVAEMTKICYDNDWKDEVRSLARLGLGDLNREQLLHYVATGETPDQSKPQTAPDSIV